MIRALTLVLLAAASASPALAEGNAENGAKVYLKCKACHDIDKGVNKVGPTLKGIVGRKVASVEGFTYSEGMAAKGAEGAVWDEATLAAYLPDPRAWSKGTKMAFGGLKKPSDVEDIVAYLKANP
jgi:cytochrome c